MPEAHGHSLWFIPRGSAGARLKEIIRELSETFATPCFPPHVTLLARVPQPRQEVISMTRELAGEFSRFQIELTEAATTRDYFRSLFIKVVADDVLVAVYDLARTRFGFPLAAEFMPHLSLLYGDLPEAEKQGVIARLGRKYPARFTVESIDVYSTDGPPEDWQLVESVLVD